MENSQFEFGVTQAMVSDDQLEKSIDLKRSSLSTEKLDMSFGEIMSMYLRDEIVINPEYQRLFRWSQFQKTRFIESLLLGIPIPPIFVAENKDGKWELVDGLQRVSTVLSFFNCLKEDGNSKNCWSLSEGELIKELEGFNIDNFPVKQQLKIKRSYCRIEITKWNKDLDMRYELFNRLNTGGSQLTDQEIRNCIFRGVNQDLNNMISELANKSEFLELINISEEKKEQLYHEELALRFFVLFDEWDKIDSNLSLYLTEYMKRKVSEEINYQDKIDLFLELINILRPFGPKIFRFSNNQFSTSLYDAFFIGVAKNIERFKNGNQPEIIAAKISQLPNDTNFKKYIGADSSSKSRIKKRTQIAIEYFGS